MPDIKNLDVETYVKLLISEELGHECNDVENPGMRSQKDNLHNKFDRKPQTRQD